MKPIDRRAFIKASALSGLGVSVLTSSHGLFASSPLETINMAVVGLNGRGKALTISAHQASNIRLTHVCDVDAHVLEEHKSYCKEHIGYVPETERDFRKLLDNKDIDAIAIAAPDHWHTPMAILALQAGKHVYVEKPCSHNPEEGEWLVNAQVKYKKMVQMGTQQRSSQTTQMAIKDIASGVIGDAYSAECWYANTRGTIGTGKVVPVPDYLDYALWQGPAPRRPYKDNIIHYNWHWFWNWGTGEVLNNGTHEIDICRWALGVKYPVRVLSTGGRFHFEDDWEFYDTQTATFQYEGGRMITWEGRSCNGLRREGLGRGVIINGTKGSMLLDRNQYVLYDLDGKVIKKELEKEQSATTDTVGIGGLDVNHMQNFSDGVRLGSALNAPIDVGSTTVTTCHLANIAQKFGRELKVDPGTGHILGDAEAMRLWSREYESGWKPAV